jgi:TATA-binding protein-associated factor Taf7
MAVSYDDVEERELGRQAKIAKLANLQLENMITDEDRALAAEEQMLSEKKNAALTEDALAFIDEMDKAYDNGEDPMQIFKRLPPELQQKITEILQQSVQPQQQQQEFQPLPQQQAEPNTTNIAKQIATNI